MSAIAPAFFREVSPDGESTRVVGDKVFDEDAVY